MMTKDRFWQLIDSVNEDAPYPSEEAHLSRMRDTLLQCSPEEILEWEMIMSEYSQAAYRNDLWAASAALGAHHTDDGFTDFRSWLISRGKEVYMSALRDPESLASVPRAGEDLNFERFAYVANEAYKTKQAQTDPQNTQDLYDVMDDHTLDAEVLAELNEELPQREDIARNWTMITLPKLFPYIYEKRLDKFARTGSDNSILRPASPDEAGLFFALTSEEDESLGTIGHVRIDFSGSGKAFWTTWHPRGDGNLNTKAFADELDLLVNFLRADGPLKNLVAMQGYCDSHGGEISGGWQQNYGYVAETESYRYCLRCNPVRGDYNAYLTAFDLQVQRLNMEQDTPKQGITMGGLSE